MLKLFLTFFKIGLFTFGGGYAMIAHVKEAVVDQKHWLSDEEFLEIIAVAESTPGPIAINMATYVGYKQKGVLGSIAATAGVVIPSFVIIYTISLFLDKFIENQYVAYAFVGIKCAVAFLILKAGFNLLSKIELKALPISVFGIIFITLIILEIYSISFSSIFFIIIGGIIGIVAYSLLKKEDKI